MTSAAETERARSAMTGADTTKRKYRQKCDKVMAQGYDSFILA